MKNIAASTLLIVALAGCDQLDTQPLTGIVETDRDGHVLRDDPGDWQPRCGDGTGYCTTPLSPNPVQKRETTSLDFSLMQDALVVLRIEDEQGNTMVEIEGKRLEAGHHRLDVGGSYPAGIYRLMILAYDNKGALLFRTYGDFRVVDPPE